MQLHDTQVTNEDVRNWKGVHLLHFDASLCSQQVRILLNEKNIRWHSHPVDLHKQQHASPWFLGINPRGVVPVLVHDGDVHVESSDIMEYLDGLPSERAAFFPKKPRARAYVKQQLAWQSSLRLDTRALTVRFLAPQTRYLKNRKVLDAYRNNGASDLSRNMEIAWWQRAAEHGVSGDRLRESYSLHRESLRKLENRLHNRQWLYGKRITVVDIAWFSTIHRLKVLGYDLSRHPYVLSYYQRLLLRPAFREELQIKGPLKIIVPAYRLYKSVTGRQLEDVLAGHHSSQRDLN